MSKFVTSYYSIVVIVFVSKYHHCKFFIFNLHRFNDFIYVIAWVCFRRYSGLSQALKNANLFIIISKKDMQSFLFELSPSSVYIC